MNIRDLLITLGIAILLGACGRVGEKDLVSPTPFLHLETAPIDSVIAEMSTPEKVGQLIVLQSDLSDATLDNLYQKVKAGRIGGLLLEDVDLELFIKVLDTTRAMADIPLLVATQEEVLLNNQFSDLLTLPTLPTIQATANDNLQQQFLELYSRQANQLGINLSFASDFSTSLGNNKPFAPIANLNAHEILSGVRGIPVQDILQQRDTSCRLDELIAPFEKFHRQGIAAFYLEGFDKLPTAQAPLKLLQHYFRQEIGFQGLLIAKVNEGTLHKSQLDLGTDLFIVDDCSELFYSTLLQEVENGTLSQSELDDKVRRILLAKKWARSKTLPITKKVTEQPQVLQASFKPTLPDNLTHAVLEDEALIGHFKDDKWDPLRYQIYENSMILLSNKNNLIPFKSLKEHEFRLLHFGASSMRTFKEYFNKYADYKSYHVGPESPDVLSVLRPAKSPRRVTVITLDDVAIKPERDSALIQALKKLNAKSKVVVVNFGDAENFAAFDTTMNLIQVFERNEMTESLAAQLLFGSFGASGKLPTNVNAYFAAEHGVETKAIRLKYGIPQEVGIAPEKLVGIDAIIKTAIQEKAMPGCQVLVAKDGNVIYSKAFGHHTFTKEKVVKTTDLYDLASITKVAATTLATMQLYEQGKLKLDNRLHELLDWKGPSTIKYISLKKLLTHHSGLQSNMPIAPYIMYRDVPNAGCDSFFCNTYSDTFSVRVADNFYFDQRQVDRIWEKIHNLPIGSQRRYRYSDVNFVLLQKVVETVSQKKLDAQLEQQFYRPLGLRYNLYNPADHFNVDQIVPTQNDYRWRHQLVRGYVHDESAALLGGVAGNAGLFSNAEDLAIPFQMLLNKGTYGGTRFLKPETIELFTKTHTSSRRGLGFYKPFSASDYTTGPSTNTFGHTGFTGTAVWADPEHNLLYIFLSNRIHPSINNRAFSRSRVRNRVQQVVYDALNTFTFEMPDLPLTPEEGGIKG